MGESLLISLREGFEAALVVSIVLAAVRRTAPEQTRAVWVGTGVALAVAVVAGLVLHVTIDGLEGTARQRTFAAICVAAAALLTWMIFWMRSHARTLKGTLEERAGEALAGGSGLALAFVAFVAVLREGLETALFLISTTANSEGADVVAGTLVGLAIAVVLGWVVYVGGTRFDLRRFFIVTGVLLVLFAGGLLDRAVGLLQGAGDVHSWDDSLYDLTRYGWLTGRTQSGRFLSGILGWDAQPSVEQAAVYLAYVIPVAVLFLRGYRRPAKYAL